jgi:DNA polymerase-3 subunit epsilon
MQALVEYIGNSVLVGHRIHFDIELINEALEKMSCGKLKNEPLDIEIMHQKHLDITNKSFSINDMVKHYKLPLSEKNSASDDAYAIGLLFLKLKTLLGFK